MKPKMSYPLLVGASDVLIHIVAKLSRSIGVGTKEELAFVDEKDRRIASNQFTFSQIVNAEASVLWVISGRILVKSRFVGRRCEVELSHP